MSDVVKALLESLTEEQKQEIIKGLLGESNEEESVSSTEAPQKKTNKQTSGRSTVINEDFTVSRNHNESGGKRPVKWQKNSWSDSGEFKDSEFDAEKFERMGKAARNRGKAKKKTVECHVCGKRFSVNPSLIYGEFLRCNRCTGG